MTDINYERDRNQFINQAILYADKSCNLKHGLSLAEMALQRMKHAKRWNKEYINKMNELCEEAGLISENWRLIKN